MGLNPVGHIYQELQWSVTIVTSTSLQPGFRDGHNIVNENPGHSNELCYVWYGMYSFVDVHPFRMNYISYDMLPFTIHMIF
jgi:hypothetical protein